MRKILTASIFVLAFCSVAFGQNSNCPTISVTGPSFIVQPGETMTFTVNVSDVDLNKIKYQWSVDKGTIIEGQGTLVITVGTEGFEDTTVTAVVEIIGLPEGCLNTDSETSVTYCPSPSFLIDEFEITSKPIDSERLDAWVAELENNPRDRGYIIAYFDKKFSVSEIKKIELFIKDYLTKEKIADDRIEIIIDRNGENSAENRVRFWRVPLGAQPPTP